jgi:hypothetical protein
MRKAIHTGHIAIIPTLLILIAAAAMYPQAVPAQESKESSGRLRVAPADPLDPFLAEGDFKADSYAVLARGWWRGSRWPAGSASRPRFPVPTLLIADDAGAFFWVSPASLRVVEAGPLSDKTAAEDAGFFVFPRQAETWGGRVPSSLGPAVTGIFEKGENRVLEVICPLVTENRPLEPMSSRAARPYFLVADDAGRITALYFDELRFVRE